MPEIQVIIEKPNCSSECSICFCNLEEEMELKQCQHSFCRNCLQEYLKTEINSLNVLKIKCPEQNCQEILSSSSLQELLDSSDFERYQKLLLQKMAKRTKDTICPKPGCSKIVFPSNDTPFTKCDCGSTICNLCGNLDHPNKTCLAAVDPEFETYAAENNLKMCLMCKTMIAKVEGCIHITCSICDYDWCWLCGREYTESHDSECTRIWSPLPPRQAIKENSYQHQGGWKKIGMFFFNIIKFIFDMIMLQVFFPYILLEVFTEIRLPHRPREYKIKLAVISVLMHLSYILGEVGLFYLVLKYPPNRIVLCGCMLLVALLPWGVKIMVYFMQPKQNQKRWMSGNVQIFHYTPANKPTQDSENPEFGAQVQLNEVAELKDQENILSPEIQIYSQRSDTFENISLIHTIK